MAKRSNDEADIEREKAYRRGYAYGIQAMMSVIAHKLSVAEQQNFEAWVADVLTPWSQGTGNARPPEPPRW
jgi:hypothetical protein